MSDDSVSSTPSVQAGPGAPETGAASGSVRAFLRGESGAVLVGSSIAYHAYGGTAGLFALLFLVPDVAMLGYLAGPRIGAAIYNLAHTYILPAALGCAAWFSGMDWAYPLVLIWIAHISFDRLMGYGLKYSTAFGDTHLGWRGGRPTG